MNQLVMILKKVTFHVLCPALLCAELLAQDAGGAARGPAGVPGFIATIFPIVVFGAIFYFLLLRPQQKANKERTQMLSAVKRMDKVLTSGGVYGTVSQVRGDTLEVKIAENVKVEVNRNYIAKIISTANQASAQAAESVQKN